MVLIVTYGITVRILISIYVSGRGREGGLSSKALQHQLRRCKSLTIINYFNSFDISVEKGGEIMFIISNYPLCYILKNIHPLHLTWMYIITRTGYHFHLQEFK